MHYWEKMALEKALDECAGWIIPRRKAAPSWSTENLSIFHHLAMQFRQELVWFTNILCWCHPKQ